MMDEFQIRQERDSYARAAAEALLDGDPAAEYLARKYKELADQLAG